MTVSVGTFEDLRPDTPQPIDRNPSIQCDGPCDRSFDWRDYWKPRAMLGNPREAKTICDECLDAAIRYHNRRTNNHELTDFKQ